MLSILVALYLIWKDSGLEKKCVRQLLNNVCRKHICVKVEVWKLSVIYAQQTILKNMKRPRLNSLERQRRGIFAVGCKRPSFPWGNSWGLLGIVEDSANFQGSTEHNFTLLDSLFPLAKSFIICLLAFTLEKRNLNHSYLSACFIRNLAGTKVDVHEHRCCAFQTSSILFHIQEKKEGCLCICCHIQKPFLGW